jgi:hypothetical protein
MGVEELADTRSSRRTRSSTKSQTPVTPVTPPTRKTPTTPNSSRRGRKKIVEDSPPVENDVAENDKKPESPAAKRSR